jgi:hypothetical protein
VATPALCVNTMRQSECVCVCVLATLLHQMALVCARVVATGGGQRSKAVRLPRVLLVLFTRRATNLLGSQTGASAARGCACVRVSRRRRSSSAVLPARTTRRKSCPRCG